MALQKKFFSQFKQLFLHKRLIHATTKRWVNDHNDEPIDEVFHNLPLGKGDVGQQTRVSFLSKDMKDDPNKIGIRTISPSGFRLYDDSFMFGPIAIFPKSVLSWRVSAVDEITPNSLELFLVLQPKLDVLFIGVGDKSNVDQVRRQLVPFLAKHKIGYEILPTEHAISSFNYLNDERRYIGAALYPPTNLAVNDADFGRVLRTLRDFGECDESPLFFGASFVGGDGVQDVVRSIWGQGKEAEEATKTILTLRAKNKAEKEKYFEERRLKKLAEKMKEDLENQKSDERKKLK